MSSSSGVDAGRDISVSGGGQVTARDSQTINIGMPTEKILEDTPAWRAWQVDAIQAQCRRIDELYKWLTGNGEAGIMEKIRFIEERERHTRREMRMYFLFVFLLSLSATVISLTALYWR